MNTTETELRELTIGFKKLTAEKKSVYIELLKGLHKMQDAVDGKAYPTCSKTKS